MIDPTAVVPASIMPAYPWLAERQVNAADIQARLRTLRTLGHPYSDEVIDTAPAALEGKTELDAMIAYLQGLGRFASDEPDEHGAH